MCILALGLALRAQQESGMRLHGQLFGDITVDRYMLR